jgi:hypothetical protein
MEIAFAKNAEKFILNQPLHKEADETGLIFKQISVKQVSV